MVAAVAMQRDEWSVAVWKLPTAAAKKPADVKPMRTFKANGEVHSLALNGQLLAVAGKHGVQIWNLEKREVVLRPLSRSTNSIAFTPDGKHLVSASERSVQVWDMATGREECKMPFGHAKENVSIVSLAVGPPLEDQNLAQPASAAWTVVTSDSSGTSWVWSLSAAKGKARDGHTMVLEHRAILTGHAEAVTGVAFAPDGKTIATTSDDRTIRLWDPFTGRERAALSSHTDAVLLAAFWHDGSASSVSVAKAR